MSQKAESFISKKDLLIVAIIISGGFITILNQTVLSPALPSIMRDFKITANEGQWLTTAFMLVNGIMIPVTAYLVDRFTTRKLFVTSMCIFTAGTIMAAYAPSFFLLLVARILQAIGAGIQMPLGSVVMMLLFPKEKRGIAMGLVGIVIAFAPAIGPTLSGWIVDTWGWHHIFRFIVPLAVIDIIFACFFLRNIGDFRKPSLDWASVFLSTVAFGGLLYGFSAAGSYGWISKMTVTPLLIGAFTLIFYIRRQLTLPEPLLNLRVLKEPIFAYSTILGMIINAGLLAGTVIFPIYLQNVLGYSALNSGLLMMPGAIVMGIMSPISGTLFDRFGPRVMSLIGLIIMTLTTTSFCFFDENCSFLYLCSVFCFRSFGMSLVNMPISTWGINSLDNIYIAHGNAVNNSARQVAASIGTAIMITIMTIVSTNLGGFYVNYAVVAGMNAAFAFAAILSGIALIIAYFKVHDDDAARQRRQMAQNQK